MTRFRARIAYDGANYHGFQRQRPGEPTIQGELERVISHLANQHTAVTGAGRTDSGVHAQGQIISFDIDWRHDSQALLRAINANLPEDIAVLQLSPASPDFHPRYDAKKRAYVYQIYNAPVRNPVYRRYSWHVSKPLDETAMDICAQKVVGTHDFATFGQPPKGINTVRTIYRAYWQRDGEWLTFYVEANAFLYRMVRSLVGSMKVVGEGKWTVDDFDAAFCARNREKCATVAPPQGLSLILVSYAE